MKSKWETHREKRYLYADYRDFRRDATALRSEVDAVDQEIERTPGTSTLLLCDLRNTVTSSEVVTMFKESAARTKGRVAQTAVVGVTGIQRILASAVARFSNEPLHLFSTVEEARDWLAGLNAKGEAINP